MPSLSVTRIAAADHPPRHLVMLHGVYGRGRNWQAIAQAVADERPEYCCWLVDLPHHGGSGPGRHGDTVRGLAQDVDDWLTAESLTPDAVLGHSFGGKVALAFAARRRDQPLQVWLVDSTPGTSQPSGSAWNMLAVLRELPNRFGTRDEAVAGIVRGGFAAPVAQWMTTNLAREGNAFVWRLDLEAMERLLRDFFSTDLWSPLEDPGPRHELHVVKASESSVISSEAATRIDRARPGRVFLHRLEGGHWIHAESPRIVAGLLVDHLP